MIPIVSREYGRIDAPESRSGAFSPHAERGEMVTIGVSSPVRFHHQSSHSPAKAPEVRASSNPASFGPTELEAQILQPPAQRSPRPGCFKSGHGTIRNGNTNLPLRAESRMPEPQRRRDETVPHGLERPKDPEKGFLEVTDSQSCHRTILQDPPSRIKHTYSDVSEEEPDAEEHAVWILVSAVLTYALQAYDEPTPHNRSISPFSPLLSTSSSPSTPSSPQSQSCSSPHYVSAANPPPRFEPNSITTLPHH